MERHKDTLKALMEYLIAHGYPPEALAVEYPAGRRRADLAVVDPESKELVAVFELKRERNRQSEKFGREQLRSYLRELGSPAVPTYLVFDKEGSPPFEIERVRFGAEEEAVAEVATPLEFTTMQRSRRSSVLAERKGQRKKALDSFLIACWACALVCGGVLACELLGAFEMSEKQLVVLGAAVVLFLIPFVSRLKILGVEFERVRKESGGG